MILTRDDRSKIEVGKNQILGIVRCHRKFSCGLSELKVTLSVIEVNFLYFSFSNLVERDINIFPGKCFFVFVFSYTSLSSTPFVFKEIWAP